jgi:hypothetical protein
MASQCHSDDSSQSDSSQDNFSSDEDYRPSDDSDTESDTEVEDTSIGNFAKWYVSKYVNIILTYFCIIHLLITHNHLPVWCAKHIAYEKGR